MAEFLLQEDTFLKTEYLIIKELLDRNNTRYVHKYKSISFIEVKKYRDLFLHSSVRYIPIGSIEFVTEYLRAVYGFNKQNPLEIPLYLRTDEFLKREYQICSYKNVPEKGEWFVKDVSALKNYTNIVSGTQMKESLPEKAHLYQFSSVVSIISEYRVYVINGEIKGIYYYDGDPTILPDIKLIKKAVLLVGYHEKWLKSYTIDVMVTPQGTAVIEIHNFTSVGLYSTLWGTELLFAYMQGIDYLLYDNHELEADKE